MINDIVDGENLAVAGDRRFDVMMLIARMVGGDQVLAPVFDPFHRAFKSHGGDADQHVLGIELATDAEAAADVSFVEVHP